MDSQGYPTFGWIRMGGATWNVVLGIQTAKLGHNRTNGQKMTAPFDKPIYIGYNTNITHSNGVRQ